MIFHNSTKKDGFQNIKIKLNLTTWMTLECSVVIFQALEYLWPQLPQQPEQPQWPQWPQQPHFTTEITEFYVSINHGTKMTYPSLSMWNGSSKPTILLIFGTLFLGDCGGQLKLLFWRLVLIIKMSTSQDFKTTFIYNLTCIFLSLRAKLKNTLQCETPCTCMVNLKILVKFLNYK
jgi:hypothetical protein